MAIYGDSSLGTTANRVNFNAFNTFPIYRIISRRPQQRQIRDLDIPVPFESGISDFETLIGKVAYVIEGIMYPGGESEYDAGLAALRKLANLEVAQSDNLADDGYVPYIFEEFARDKQIFMKVLYVDVPENTRKGLVQPFRLVCKVKDPTIYGYPSKTASTQGTDPTTLGGTAVFPFSFPIIFGASTISVSNVAINNGDVPGYPASITVVGPINNPTITNTTTGEYITVSTNLATSSDVLVITYDKDTLSVTSNGVSVLSNVTTASTYFKLEPGDNTITLTGSTIGSGAYVSVAYYDSWSLG